MIGPGSESVVPARQATRLERRISRAQLYMLVGVHALALVAVCLPTARGAVAFAVAYVLTAGLGISLGFHRGLSHQAFRASTCVRAVLASLGTLTLQGGPITWVGFHRAHHKFADRAQDPHSAARGFWWSHVAWAVHKGPNGYRPMRLRALTASIADDPVLAWLERRHLLVNVAAFALGIVVLGPAAALWAFPLRIVFVWHITWLTNSYAHDVTRARHKPGDSARNRPMLALVTFGEGLHRNHHDEPSNPSFAHRRAQLDLGFVMLRIMAAARLVRLRPARSVARRASGAVEAA